jgi:hypothetical protein
MIERLYNEISPENNILLEQHLMQCNQCQTEYQELLRTHSILEHWEDVNPQLNLTFVQETDSIFSKIKRTLKPGRLAYGFGIACAAILLFLLIGNTRISIKDGDFEMQMGLFKSRPAVELAEVVTPVDLENFRKENYALISQLLNEYDRQNKVETMLLMNQYLQDNNQNRQEDLKLVSSVLTQIQTDNEQRMNQTDQALGELIRYVNLQNTGQMIGE